MTVWPPARGEVISHWLTGALAIAQGRIRCKAVVLLLASLEALEKQERVEACCLRLEAREPAK